MDDFPATTAREQLRDVPPRHEAALQLRCGRASLRARTAISTNGLLATAALVSATLLSVAVIIAVSTRKLPRGAMPAGMKRSRWPRP